MMPPSPGHYRLVRKPKAAIEISELLEAYVTEDEWEETTASESPAALTDTPTGKKKRSGEYAKVNTAEEIVQLKRECYR